MKKLWQKNWQLDTFIESFETKDDLVSDQKLIKFDVLGSMAHARMLCKIGILSKQELATVTKGLLEILNLARRNNFVLKMGDEDIHTKIENFLTDKYGEIGKKIHTGRSRNDQVLTDLRLFTKEQMLHIWKDIFILIESFYKFAKKYEFVPMPGYTHMQKAMPSSVGMWAGSFTESLFDDLVLFKAAYLVNDRSPLGSAAGYGVSLPLDREYTSKLLGFGAVQINSLYCQNSRGKFEACVVGALHSILLDINKFASDVLLFTTSEFSYFNVAKKLCTGSSIMPQKKNVDVAELLRSKIHIALGHYVQILSLSGNLFSGYNKDLQDTKKPLMENLEVARSSINAAAMLIENLTPQKEYMSRALTSEVFATNKVMDLVLAGMPFREAYNQVGSNISKLSIGVIDQSLKKSSHIGGIGNLGLDQYIKRLTKEKQIYKTEQKNFLRAIKNLMKEEIL